MADYCWSIKRGLTDIEHENQEGENFYHSSSVHRGFISAVSLLNDLMKILVGLGIFSRDIFKDLIIIAKIVFLNKWTNICWFRYKLRCFYDFTLRNITIGQYYVYRKTNEKNPPFFPKMRHVEYSKNGS